MRYWRMRSGIIRQWPIRWNVRRQMYSYGRRQQSEATHTRARANSCNPIDMFPSTRVAHTHMSCFSFLSLSPSSLYVPKKGFGDSVNALTSSFRYAIGNGRLFFIIWSNRNQPSMWKSGLAEPGFAWYTHE